MSKHTDELVFVQIIPSEQGNPSGALADAEVIVEVDTGPRGFTLVGFAVWERRDGGKNVTFPVRQYSVNGARRHVLLLRSSDRALEAQEPLRRCIPDAHSRLETHA
jgi:hypothetical protein